MITVLIEVGTVTAPLVIEKITCIVLSAWPTMYPRTIHLAILEFTFMLFAAWVSERSVPVFYTVFHISFVNCAIESMVLEVLNCAELHT